MNKKIRTEGGQRQISLFTIFREEGCEGYMENLIAAFILAVLIGSASAYLIKAKRKGVKCVGCPAGGSCSKCHKTKEEI